MKNVGKSFYVGTSGHKILEGFSFLERYIGEEMDDKIMDGRCPKCGEIFRFFGSTTVCKVCGMVFPTKKKESKEEK